MSSINLCSIELNDYYLYQPLCLYAVGCKTDADCVAGTICASIWSMNVSFTQCIHNPVYFNMSTYEVMSRPIETVRSDPMFFTLRALIQNVTGMSNNI